MFHLLGNCYMNPLNLLRLNQCYIDHEICMYIMLFSPLFKVNYGNLIENDFKKKESKCCFI